MDKGKSFSEALIFASTNPQYDKRLFVELCTIKITNAEHVLLMFCLCSALVVFMDNLLSYCGLVDARKSASEKDLPVLGIKDLANMYLNFLTYLLTAQVLACLRLWSINIGYASLSIYFA